MTPRVRNRHRVKERYASDPFSQSPIIRWNANSATLLNEVNRDAVLPDVRHDAAHKAVFEAAPATTTACRFPLTPARGARGGGAGEDVNAKAWANRPAKLR